MKFIPAIFANLVIAFLASWPVFPATLEKIEARVNDEILTSTELERMLRPIYRQYSETATGDELTSLMGKARDNVIVSWVERRLILQEVQKQEDLKIDLMEVERQFDEARSRFPTQEAFDDALAREGLDEGEFKKNLEDQFKVRVLTYREITSKTVVSPRDIEDYYGGHEKDFAEPEMARVSHILIPLSEDPAQKEAARALAESVLGQLKAGADFETLAREYSKGPRADQGGDLGYFERKQMRSKLDEAAFSLDVGRHSGVIETDMGYHIIKVTGRKKPSQKSLLDSWSAIEDKLFREKFQKRYDEWIEKLKARAYVVIEE